MKTTLKNTQNTITVTDPKVYDCLTLAGVAPDIPEQPRWPGCGLGWRELVLVWQRPGHHRGVKTQWRLPDCVGKQRPEGTSCCGPGCPLWVRNTFWCGNSNCLELYFVTVQLSLSPAGQVPVLVRLGGQPSHWENRDGRHQQKRHRGG